MGLAAVLGHAHMYFTFRPINTVQTSLSLPKQTRDTKIVKDTPPEEIAAEIVAWIKG